MTVFGLFVSRVLYLTMIIKEMSKIVRARGRKVTAEPQPVI